VLAGDVSNQFAPGIKSMHRGSVKDLGIDTAGSRDIVIRDVLHVSSHQFLIDPLRISVLSGDGKFNGRPVSQILIV
jgi:hypothetical protein